jgi:hypothetical protein
LRASDVFRKKAAESWEPVSGCAKLRAYAKTLLQDLEASSVEVLAAMDVASAEFADASVKKRYEEYMNILKVRREVVQAWRGSPEEFKTYMDGLAAEFGDADNPAKSDNVCPIPLRFLTSLECIQSATKAVQIMFDDLSDYDSAHSKIDTWREEVLKPMQLVVAFAKRSAHDVQSVTTALKKETENAKKTAQKSEEKRLKALAKAKSFPATLVLPAEVARVPFFRFGLER